MRINLPKPNTKFFLILFAVILVLAGSAGTYFFYTKYQKTQKLLKDPTAIQQAEIKDVTAKVSKLMDLPQGEDPSVATVLDKEKLKDQPFFARTENGDKVIIYTKAGQAILYRPSTNRIISVAPINLGETATTIKVAAYNGTGISGLTTKFAADVVKLVSNLTVAVKANAARSDYEKSLVVDLTGQKADLAKQMASLIGGDVSTLPDGETKPSDLSIDLLIILGKNYASPAVAPSPLPSPEQATPTP